MENPNSVVHSAHELAMPQIRILHVGVRMSSICGTPLIDLNNPRLSRPIYLFAPSSHVAHGGVQLGRPPPPGRSSVRTSITSAAVHPPTIAVTVKYILSLAAAVIARSTPPGIAVILSAKSATWRLSESREHTDSWQCCKWHGTRPPFVLS